MKKPEYLGLSNLDMNKLVICEFWCDYTKPKCGKNAKLCYINTDNLIVHVKSEDVYEDLARNVETSFNTSNYEVKRFLPISKNKKVIELVKEELMKEIAALRPKIYSYLKDEDLVDKKAKGTKKCLIK